VESALNSCRVGGGLFHTFSRLFVAVQICLASFAIACGLMKLLNGL